MKNTIRIVAIIGAIMLVAALGVSALAASGGDSPTPAGSTSPSVTPSSSPSPGDGDDFSGPCDEEERANDPECQGVTLDPEDDDDGVQVGADISGNCDEPEHVNDPECQGGGIVDDDDNSGPGNDDDQGDADD